MSVKLLTVDEVIKRMSLGDHEDILNAVDSALNGVTEFVSSKIDTSLEKLTDTVEVFHPRVGKYWDTLPDDLLKLRPRNGFIKSGSVELKSGLLLSDVVGHTGSVVPSTDFSVDLERGYIYLALEYDTQWISVKYSSGIQVPAGTAPPAVTDVPLWLQEAVLTYVPVVLNQNQTSNRSAEIDAVMTSLKAHGSSILDPHVRNLPFAFSPAL